MAELLYGFHRLADRLNDLAATPNSIPAVNAAADAAINAHNAALNAVLTQFAFQTPIAQQPYVDRTRSGSLQPLDEHGRALPRRLTVGEKYTIGLPLYTVGDAVGETWLTQRHQTIQGVNDTIADIANSDLNWLAEQLFSSLFRAADSTFFDDEYGQLTIKPLANGDAVRYPVRTSVGAKTDTHLLAQSAAIDETNNPLSALAKTIREHPDNAGDVLIFAGQSQVASIRQLGLFFEVADPAITAAISASRLSATAPATPFGTVVGYYSGDARAWIVQWDRLDEVGNGGYLIALSTGGPRPIAQRIDPAVLGLALADTRQDYPYYERQYVRRAGFGAWNRTGAAIMQIGSATYAVPSRYEREN